MTTTDMPNRDHNETVLDDHLSLTIILRYLAALLAGVVFGDESEWDAERRHLQRCSECAEVAVEHLGQLLWDAPEWELLEPGEVARRAQQIWIERLEQDPRAPMREAAAQQLGTLAPLSKHGMTVLIEATVGDEDDDVRRAAADALASVQADLAARAARAARAHQLTGS